MIAARWQVPVATLLRGLREEGREEPTLDHQSFATYLVWSRHDVVLGQTIGSPLMRLYPADDDKREMPALLPLGADWVSEVRRLAPLKANVRQSSRPLDNECPPAPAFDYSRPELATFREICNPGA